MSTAHTNPRYLDAWMRAMDRLVDQFPTGLLVMTIIDRNAQAPNDASKASIRSTILRHAAQINAFAYVVEGEGFKPAAMRSALSLISLAARYPFPQKVFGQIEEAVPWMLSRPSAAGSAPALIGLANSLRTQLASIAAAG